MKNLGLLILGIVLGALAMYFYCSQNESLPNEAAPLTKPVGIITPAEAKVLDVAYNAKHKLIDTAFFANSDTEDNRSSWWSLENIQNYINYAENQAGELGYTMDGLRLYLGAYPNVGDETGLTTMFFIPTGYKNKSQGGMIPSIQKRGHDIPGGNGLNLGHGGEPPGSNYPQ